MEWGALKGLTSRRMPQVASTGVKPDLRPGEEKLPPAQANSGHAHDAPGNTGRSHRRLTETGPLWTAQHRLYRTGESDRPSWGGSAGSPHVGQRTTVSSSLGPSAVVAGLLSFCASPHITTSGIRTAPRARWQTSGATLSPANASDGSGKNPSTMDSGRGPLFAPAADPMLSQLRALEARKGSTTWQRRLSEAEGRWGASYWVYPPPWTAEGRE